MRILLLFAFSLASLLAQFVPNQYIVELKDESAVRPAERRQRIRDRQARVETALGARGFKMMGRTEYVANALLVEAPGDGSDVRKVLEQFSDVARVHKVRIFKKTLDRAAQVHAVVAAWERLGLDKAGVGMKIGILDSGIQTTHPGFQDESLPKLDGYPKVNNEADLVYTNRKVIVARSYSNLWARRDTDNSVLDRSGHGTAVAMSAAGTSHLSPFGKLAGMAPAAYIGVYKIFGTPGVNDSTTDSAILKAIDDAVADGMDVINLSFGTMLAARPENDIIVTALERAEAAGVIAVVSAGNDGPGLATLGSPASAPTALTVGASENSRLFASAVTVSDGGVVLAKVGSRTSTSGSISGPMVSIVPLDASGLACDALAPSSLSGKIALISRGTCTFEIKINNASRAGATAAVIYSDEARADDFITISAGTATLPAVFITYADGKKLKERLDAAGSLDVVVDLALNARDTNPNRLADFSSNGPVPGVAVKPDLLAVGTNVLTAAQSNYSAGEVYSASGYTLIDGTSFSSPITAGLVAVLKAARPGLKPVAYRSMLVNSARPLAASPQLTLMQTGAGLADLSRALDAPLLFNPVSVSFIQNVQSIVVSNLNSTAAIYNVSVEARQGTAPTLVSGQLELAANATAQVLLQLDLASLDAGAYVGTVILQSEGGPMLRVPYWFGKADSRAKTIQVLDLTSSGRAGGPLQDLLFFRVLDANGIAITTTPKASVISGGATIREVQSRDFDIAGSFGLEIVLGIGANVIEVDAGNGLTQRFSILGR